ncbi:hypothetical protein Poli38472_006204 [Pythium oligandrum]|uniref:Fibronectin type-III domain-containing protein n=1 Tax=Pythium oligandrum TaxID=41045 RepID=A0A8K1CRY9_PYTOL|nr:hypothetical protein Poli38472_006204 [Pythium oligandrum]|eukprot:TMW68736.1 hypothetical protein Poli38472_006204 [Pythium oligandrum]
MKELKSLCFTEGQESTFFMCLSSHGARVTSGTNEGSYVLFSETRLSSEEELLLTAIHEQELARLVHEIPCRNKFLALELCQTKEATEKPAKEDEKIRNRIHDEFASRFYAQLAKLELSTRGEGYDRSIDVEPRRSHTVILESCDVKTESPLRHSDDQVSNFLHRLNFAFHGGAACLSLDDELIERPHLRLKEVIKYVKEMIMMDAALQNELVKTEYKKQVRTKFELIAEFQEVTHTPQLVGDADGVDFAIGDVPAAPTEHPAQPRLEGSTLNSITISWDAIKGFPPSTSQEIPTILGYHIQYQGDGRTCESWKRAAAFQVLTFENAVHLRKKPPTKVTVFGIPSELAFRFRVRARTAGGWGPFSPVSPAFRTQSVASHHDQFTTVQAASEAKGVEGILALMSRHVANRDIQRVCVEFLGRMALKVKSPQQSRRLIPGLDQPAVTLTIRSMDRFRHDTPLIQQGCLFLGRLAMSDDAWRRALLKMENPRCLEFLQDIHNRFAKTDSTTASSTRWAMERLRGTSARRRFSPEEAARRIQGLYRMRKARQYVQSLAESIYTQMIDPESGMAFFYNTRTGTTAWSLPSFLQV